MAFASKPYLKEVSLDPTVPVDREAWPYCIPAVRGLGELRFHADVTFFVGENGSGKSTVLEAIALALGYSPEGGTKNVRLATTESVSPLHHALRVVRGIRRPRNGYFLRAESFFNVATYMDQVGIAGTGYGDRSLHRRSHGEAFLTLLTTKFRGQGLFLLDEPEAALSPSRQLAALAAIHRLVLDGSQFLVATHSPILLAYPRASILQFGDDGIRPAEYDELEHVAVTRDFLVHREQRITELLGGVDDGD